MDYYNWLRPHQYNNGMAPSRAEENLNLLSGISWPLQTDFKLEVLLDLAKSYYVKYKQQGIEVRNYERLRSAKLSKLSYLLLYDILKTLEKDHHLIGSASYIEQGIQSIVSTI